MRCNPAYVWWFCSALTSPACASDQINVLTPIDSTTGEVQIVVTRVISTERCDSKRRAQW